jgi:hypothetical protein
VFEAIEKGNVAQSKDKEDAEAKVGNNAENALKDKSSEAEGKAPISTPESNKAEIGIDTCTR